MKKIISILLVMITILSCTFFVQAKGNITYSNHLTGEKNYDVSNSSIAWVKQATGALIWVPEDSILSEEDIINQAKNNDPSLKNACKSFDVLKGEGVKYTPNTNGSKAKVSVLNGVLNIEGNYSHFVNGYNENKVEPETPVVPETPETPVEEGEKVNLRIDTAKKMAVKFEDGNVYYNGDMKEVVVGKEYAFQIASVNWENGIYDENNGLCGTVVYRMKVVHEKEFKTIREIALQNPERYTVKGMDIIDNEGKYIYINCDAGDFHLETDVNNFFMAYRFHFKKGDYNKQTGIVNVVKPTESLSVNLPLGTTVTCNAYEAYSLIDNADIFIENNNGTGKYADIYLTSVNDYTWNR